MFIPVQRATVLVATPSNKNNNLNHFFIILTNPDTENRVLIINITSSDKSDETCILTEEDHSFINRKSYISYKNCNTIKVDRLSELVIQTYELIGKEVFDKIIKGLYKSKRTTQKVKFFYTNYLK